MIGFKSLLTSKCLLVVSFHLLRIDQTCSFTHYSASSTTQPSFIVPFTTNMRSSVDLAAVATTASTPQLLEFIEPETKVKVKIVGSMHYNPTSIQLAKNTIEELGMVDELGSVIIESCDIRWEDSQTMDPVTKRVLRSEMGAASEKAFSFNRPVVLGDQRINVTISNLRSAFKETVIDLSLPPKGWQRFARNISAAWEETTPSSNENDSLYSYLNFRDFLDPKLLLAAPVSLLKYPLSIFSKSPLLAFILFGLTILPPILTDGISTPLTWVDYAGSLGISALETSIFARLLLKELLQERNEVLAESILNQCRIYETKKDDEKKSIFPINIPFFSSPQGIISPNYNEGVFYATSKSTKSQDTQDSMTEKTVVAVLGMAHCNGVMKLLAEGKVK